MRPSPVTAATLRRDRERRDRERLIVAREYDEAADVLERLDAFRYRTVIRQLRAESRAWLEGRGS